MIPERSPLHAVYRLIQQARYAQAAALAGYYPASAERRAIQCLALLLQDKRSDAARLMPGSAGELPAFARMLKSLGNELGVAWERLDTRVNSRDHSYLNYVWLELTGSGGNAADRTGYLWRNLARHGMQLSDWELARIALERALETDRSPRALLEGARLVLRMEKEAPAEPGWHGPSCRDLVETALALANRDNARADVFPDGAFLLLTLDPAAEREAADLLNRALAWFPDQLGLILGSCVRLASEAAKGDRPLVSAQIIRLATNLVGNLEEYLEARASGVEGRLKVLLQERPVFSNAPWYREGDEHQAVLRLLARTPKPPGERELLQLTRLTEFPPEWRADWVVGALARRGRLSPDECDTLAAWAGTLPHHLRSLVMEALFQVRPGEVSGVEVEDGSASYRLSIEDSEPRRDYYRIPGLALESAAASYLPQELRREQRALPGRKEKQPRRRRLTRYTRVHFPETCEVERKAELRLQLTARPPARTRVSRKVAVGVEPEAEEATLSVVLTAPGFAVDSPVRTMTLPVEGDSEEVVFPLFPLNPGDRTLEVEVFHGAERVTYLLVRTRVESARSAITRLLLDDIHPRELGGAAAPEPQIAVVEQLHTRLGRRGGRRVAPAERRILHVTWLPEQDKLLYRVISPHGGDEYAEEHPRPGLHDAVCDEIRNLNAFLHELVTYDHPDDDVWEALQLNLRAKALTLAGLLVPEGLRERIRTWPADSTLVVDTNEQWIPWEILHDGTDYLGVRFVLARAPRHDQRARFLVAPPRGARPRRTLSRIVNVVGGEVEKEHADRAARTFGRFTPPLRVETIREKPVSVLRNALPGVDALHLTCHGLLDPHLLQVAETSSQPLNLLPDTVQVLPLKQGSVVFANACGSDLALVMFGNFTSFGWEFYRHGADVFIGTLGAVPTLHAVYFAEQLYARLFEGGAAPTIGKAVQQARRLAAKRRNLFSLLYCLYGDPDTVVAHAQPRTQEHADPGPARLEAA